MPASISMYADRLCITRWLYAHSRGQYFFTQCLECGS